MVTLTTTRAYLKDFHDLLLPFILEYKRTRLENCTEKTNENENYLGAQVVNCLVDEIDYLVQRKIITTAGQKVKLQLSRAQGIVLFQSMLKLPIPSSQVYLQQLRNTWVMILDSELTQEALYDQYR